MIQEKVEKIQNLLEKYMENSKKRTSLYLSEFELVCHFKEYDWAGNIELHYKSKYLTFKLLEMKKTEFSYSRFLYEVSDGSLTGRLRGMKNLVTYLKKEMVPLIREERIRDLI